MILRLNLIPAISQTSDMDEYIRFCPWQGNRKGVRSQ
jgi:hypothetical protein